jgi:hypothetical protein
MNEQTRQYLDQYQTQEEKDFHPSSLFRSPYIHVVPVERIIMDPYGNAYSFPDMSPFYVNEKHHKFKLLNEVFQSFLETNNHRGNHYTLEELLKTKFSENLYLRYEQHGIPYLGTVYDFKYPKKDLLNIKLNNDGFSYLPKHGVKIPYRHHCDGWVALQKKDYEDLANIVNAFQELSTDCGVFERSKLFYNFTEKRLDLKILSKDLKHKDVMITFERGAPWVEDEIDYDSW